MSPGPPALSPSWGTQTQVARSCWWTCRGTSRVASRRLQEGRPCVTRTHRVWPVGRKTGISDRIFLKHTFPLDPLLLLLNSSLPYLRYRVDELPGACLLYLPNIDHNDAGPYKAIFPARLRDNIKFNVNIRIVPSGHSDIIWVSGGISSIIVVILCFAVGFLCYSKRFPCHHKSIAERNNTGYEMNSVGDLSIQSSDQKNVYENNRNCGKKSSANQCFTNESYSEIG